MGEKLIIGPINKGLKTDREPFNIDNDSFPELINAYQWRGRILRKRGIEFLCRLQRVLGTTDGAGNFLVTINPHPIATGLVSFTVGSNIFTDPGTTADPGIQTLLTNGPGTATLDRVNGILTIAGSNALTSVIYFPTLPVMGLEDLTLNSTQFPGLLAFDTKYAYNVPTTAPYTPYDVNFYKNPSNGTYPGYIAKGTQTAFVWNGQSYQQFWTTNYQGALWATNGITVPFNITNIGMQYKVITGVAITAIGPPAIANLTIVAHGLVVGDFLFINEVQGITGINLQTGYVIAVLGVDNVSVEFPNATLGGAYTTGGIAQYLTNNSDTTKDCIKWYDGDPTNGTGLPSASTLGWVNFAPPLSFLSYSIADLPPAIYYLVGARMIIPFKDRLLFLGPVVQSSSAGSQVYLQDTIVYSQNGTPYYTSSFSDPTSNYGINATIPYNQILVPANQTATPFSYFADNTGFGGFVTAGTDQPITTASSNEDALIIGFSSIQTRLIYTGNDILPFNFFLINSEYGSASTFSAINTDDGVLSRGTRGFVITGQTSCQRFDTEILPQVFEINLQNNGNERFTAQRDFINEWVYFTYLANTDQSSIYIFPNQTLQFNYRDQSWGIFNENYTHYGQFRKQSGDTWLTIKTPWNTWNQPWNDGVTSLFQPDVIAGNQQGFIVIRINGTSEDTSLIIQNITANTVRSPDHGLTNGDYIIISAALGTIGSQVNNKIFSVTSATQNTFVLNPPIGSGTYLGGGLITRLYVPIIKSKQFPQAWGMGRKTRIGVQQYLLSKTDVGQVQLLIFLSQDNDTPFNDNQVIQEDETIYSTVLYTCPESTNLGLTPANANLQMPFASRQSQIWHRVNTSLIGDTIQFAITLSDAQMRQFISSPMTFIITGATQAYPAVLNASTVLGVGSTIQISGVQGMTQLNNDLSSLNPVYEVIAVTPTTISINVDSSAFSAYTSGGVITVMQMPNQETEIEFHGAIIDVTASQLLV
jgi:hypothetical protein